MSKSDERLMTVRDATPLFRKLRNVQDLVLVGGMALNFWADRYARRKSVSRALAANAPFVTKDTDFLGDRDAVEEIANALGGTYRIAAIDDATPSAGIVLLPARAAARLGWPPRAHQIDVMRVLAGLSEAEVLQTAVTVEIGGAAVQVMHPLLCLESRIHGITTRRRTDEVAIRQARVAVVVAMAWFEECLATTGDRAALAAAKRIRAIALSAPGLHVFLEHGVDVLETIPLDAMPKKYRDLEWPRVVARVQAKRERLRKLLRRRKPRS
jgi:hypothetical protein